MDRKTMYVWAGCLLVFIFVLFALFSVMGGGKGDVKPDDFSNMNPKAFDLAQLPFANDAAEQELLSKYTDLDGNLPESTLYSPDEKAARQDADAFSGIPAAPDAEYAAAAKDIPDSSPASTNYGSGGRGTPMRASPTVIGQLQTGQSAMGSRGGSGGTTWAPSNFSNRDKDNNGKISASKDAADKLKNNQTGRALLGVAGELSNAAKQNAEGAAHTLAKAYAQGKDAAQMDGDMEKALSNLATDGLTAGKGGGGPSVNDVANAVKDTPKDKTPDKPDDKNCSGYWDCLWKDALKNLANGLGDVATGMLKKWTGIDQSANDYMNYAKCVEKYSADECNKPTGSSSNSNTPPDNFKTWADYCKANPGKTGC